MWKERVAMGVELELLLISTKFFLNQTGQHTYPPNPELTAVKKIRANMKRDARNADVTTNNIASASIPGDN